MISEVDFEQNTDECTNEAIFDLGEGWQLSLDRREIVPEDPGEGSPALVQSEDAFGGAASFQAARLEGAVSGTDGDVPLAESVLEKLDELEEVVENFVTYGVSSPELHAELADIPRVEGGESPAAKAKGMQQRYQALMSKHPELGNREVMALCCRAFNEAQSQVAVAPGDKGIEAKPVDGSTPGHKRKRSLDRSGPGM